MSNSETIPKPGSWMYKMTVDQKSSNRFLKLFKIMNKIVVPLYRLRILPLFGFGFRILMLTTIGHRTKKLRRTPVEYFKIDGVIHIVAGYGLNAHWFQNIRSNPEKVTVQVGFRSFHPKIEILEGDRLEEFFKWMVRKNPKYSSYGFGWDPKTDDPDTADFSYISKAMRVIKLHKRES